MRRICLPAALHGRDESSGGRAAAKNVVVGPPRRQVQFWHMEIFEKEHPGPTRDCRTGGLAGLGGCGLISQIL